MNFYNVDNGCSLVQHDPRSNFKNILGTMASRTTSEPLEKLVPDWYQKAIFATKNVHVRKR